MNEQYLSVGELNNYIKGVLERDSFLNRVYLKGEISNFKNHTTGHFYFTLKDDTSRINAVMFASSARNVDFDVKDGMNVLVSGRISAYPSSGTYQIYVDKMTLDGVGNLYIEFEKLKKKLEAQGLFDKMHKKAIPKYPSRIGVVTAPTGAAIKDIMSTIKRRFPACEVILFPSLVQGGSAAPNIVKQIRTADSYNLDTLIVGRGGGSIEDLWAFNEEIVARAIYECKTPVISAVGHEIDFTIADFVADLRAPTPTGAAEMAVPTVVDTLNILNQYRIRLNKNIKNMVNKKYIELRSLKNSYILKNPMAMYDIKIQKLDSLIEQGNKSIKTLIDNKKFAFDKIKESHVLKNPLGMYDVKIQKLASLVEQNNRVIKNIIESKTYNLEKIKESYVLKNPYELIEKKKKNYDILISTLKALNPLGILEKGYSVVKVNDKVYNDAKDFKVKDEIDIILSKGKLKAEVKEIVK